MTDHFPLNGLNIVVTRPRDQAIQLARDIEHAGGVPIMFPLLEISPVQDTRELSQQISRLDQFDLAIFISPNAVDYGIAAIRDAGKIPSGLRVATVGQGSAKALRALGVENIIAPSERFDSEGLLALPELQDVSGWRVIIFRGDGGRELLGDTLKARGATVEYAACYQRGKPQHDPEELLAIQPDAITVTSSEALAHFWQMLDEGARKSLGGVPLFVPHPRIAGLAGEQGWQHVKLAASGDSGMLAALITWANHNTGNKMSGLK